MSLPKVSVVLPCYNEKELAVEHTREVHSFLKNLGWNFELIVCDDASTDGTAEALGKLTEPEIRVLHYTNGPSRRENLSRALQDAKGEVLVYMDMDLSTDLKYLNEIVTPVSNNSYDIAIGSRYQQGAEVKRELLRLVYSKLYNGTIRMLFGSRVLDHQCGFKAFRREVFHELAEQLGYDQKLLRGWFWDAELLIRAQQKKLRILEIPVKWISAKKSSFHFFRELKVLPYMLGLRMRLRNESQKNGSHGKH
jgi:glycosyltransferase involved in cell wall biosynthesis